MEITTIQIETSLKEKLDSLKLHNKESYNELIKRLSNLVVPKKMDRLSLIETIETLSDPEEMKQIAQGLKNVEKGETVDFEDLKKQLKLDV